jgi:hypothetical protein
VQHLTIALAEARGGDLAEYCRSKGLYPDQVKAWRDTAIESQDSSRQTTAAQTGEVLTEAQVVALEKKQEDDVAHGEIETAHPG